MDDYWQMPGDDGTYDTEVTIQLPYRMRERMRREFLDRLLQWVKEQELGEPSLSVSDVACTCDEGEHPQPRLLN